MQQKINNRAPQRCAHATRQHALRWMRQTRQKTRRQARRHAHKRCGVVTEMSVQRMRKSRYAQATYRTANVTVTAPPWHLPRVRKRPPRQQCCAASEIRARRRSKVPGGTPVHRGERLQRARTPYAGVTTPSTGRVTQCQRR